MFEAVNRFKDMISGIFIFDFDLPSSYDALPNVNYYCSFTPRGKPAYDVLTEAYSNHNFLEQLIWKYTHLNL